MQSVLLSRARTLVAPLAIAAIVIASAPLHAQRSVTWTDIQSLEELASSVDADLARAAEQDSTLASRLRTELADVRDEIAYLRVTLRREGRVSANDYQRTEQALISLQRRAQTGAIDVGPNAVPVGTEIDVRLQSRLDSKTAVVEDRIDATTVADLRSDDGVLIPAGSVMRGIVTDVKRAGRVHRKGSVTLQFDRITIDGRSYEMFGTLTEAVETRGVSGEKAKIGTGAGVGAVIGGILGGFKGALAGILIGAGGTVAATEGENVDLPPGTVLRVRFDSTLDVG